MNADDLAHILARMGACAEARDWSRGKSLAEAWATCERSEWMAWLCLRLDGGDPHGLLWNTWWPNRHKPNAPDIVRGLFSIEKIESLALAYQNAIPKGATP